MSQRSQSIIALILSTCIYGTYGVLSRYLGNKFDLFFQFSSRAFIICLVLIIPLFIQRSIKEINKKDAVWLFWRTMSGVAASVAIFVAFNHIPIGTAYFLLYAGGVAGGLFIGSLLFGEKITMIKTLSLLFSFVGLFFIFSLDFSLTALRYLCLAFAAGVSMSMWNTFSKKISTTYTPLYLTFLDWVFSLPLYLAVSLLLHEHWTSFSLSFPWVINIIYALSGIATGQLIIFGFKHIDAQIGTVVMLTEILFGILFGFLFFHETIGTLTVIGGTLILAAIVLPEIDVRKMIKRRNRFW